MDGLALEGEDVERFRPRADTALRFLLTVIRDERAGVVCMTSIVWLSLLADSCRLRSMS